MTPTLSGRWQTRFVLFCTVIAPVSLIFAALADHGVSIEPEPLVLGVVMLATGLVLDPLYQQLQRFRWDQDWPVAFFALTALLEGAMAVGLMRYDWFPGLETCSLARIDRVSRHMICLDYVIPSWPIMAQIAVISGLSCAFIAGIGQIFFPRWRLKGCEFGPFAAGDR